MEALSPEKLSANAFRVLGLSAAAGQADVDAAARRMRIWPRPEQIPPTPWDLPWLGPAPRARNDIEQAVSRLNDPVSRIHERLFWFAGNDAVRRGPPRRGLFGRRPAAKPATGETGASSDRSPPCAGRDSALADLASNLLADPHAARAGRWGRALADLCRETAGRGYRDWFLAAERDGDFEKRAEPREVLAALAGFPDRVADALAARARQALDDNRADVCVRLVGLLRSAGPSSPSSLRAASDVADRVEDLLASRCERLRDELFRGINWGGDNWPWHRAPNLGVCTKAAGEVAQSVAPLLEALPTLDDTGGQRLRRVGMPAARMLRNLGLGWSRCGQAGKARATFRRGIELAQLARDRQMEQKLRGDLADLKKPRATGGARGWGVAVAAVVIAVSRLAFTSHDSGRTNLTRDPPVFAVPVPGVPTWRQLQWERQLSEKGLVSPPATAPTADPADEVFRGLVELSRREAGLREPATEPATEPTTGPAADPLRRRLLLPPEFLQGPR